MKKDKNSLKQKIVIAIACLVIVACTISMTTMAWFTDTMQGTTNLTFGKIKLSDEYTKYTFNTPEAPAVASRKINDKNWTIVLDETSNDAFIRLKVSYGAPVSYTLTTDSTYLPNKAYYDSSYNKLEAVESNATSGQYVVGDEISGTVYECNYSLAYIENTVSTSENVTLAKIAKEIYTTQYHAVSVAVLGNTFLKGVKYYAFVGGQFRALIGSTTYDANTDYYYGQSFADTDIATITTTTENEVVTAVSGLYVEYKYQTAATDNPQNPTTKTLGIFNGELRLADTTANPAEVATIGIDSNSAIGTTTNATSGEMYCNTIYNAYIDWLIENVLLPESPEVAGDLGDYTSITTVNETNTVTTDNKYGFIRTDGTAQGTAEYYLVSDVTGTMLAAKRTNEANVTDSNDNEKTVEAGKSYNYVFAGDGDIKIADSADQITLKSATLTAIADSTAFATAVGVNGDPTKVLVKHNIMSTGENPAPLRTYYTLYDGEGYAADTFYTYTGDVTVYNDHVYFLEVAENATPLVLKYAQKDLGLGLSVDIQAIQTILSRKATADDANLFETELVSVSVGDKLTIAIMTAEDSHTVTHNNEDDSLAGKLGAYKSGTIVRVATIADIAPYFVAQFDRPAN